MTHADHNLHSEMQEPAGSTEPLPWWTWAALALLAVVVVLLLLAVLTGASGEDTSAAGASAAAGNGLTVRDAWVRATVGSAPAATEAAGGSELSGMAGDSGRVSAAYLVIDNASDQPDRLVAARAIGAASVEIHETTVENDVARMRPVEGGVEIPARGSVTLEPRGIHLMLLGLGAELAEGQTVHLTLTFQSGAEIALDAPVRAAE